MNITDEIVDKAHVAFEKEAARWKIERSSVGGIVYEVPALDLSPTAVATGGIFRFDTWEEATLFKRDKIIRAALAVL